jgi:hypothetical protein
VHPFFRDLGHRLATAMAHRGPRISPPDLDSDTSRELLDLTRVVAHTQERRFGPLAAYLTGVAVGRAEASGTHLEPGMVAELVHQVWTELEADAGAERKAD